MKIDRNEVLYVAKLGRLLLSEKEVSEMTSQLNRILEYVTKLNALDTTDVVPTAHANPRLNPLREDNTEIGLTREKALQNAPKTDGMNFIVPKIL